MEMFTLPQVIAHRGASGYAPENTLAAFAKAKKMGADMVEFDVMLTKDGHPIVMHDDDLRRTCNARGRVDQLTLDELKVVYANRGYTQHYPNEKIPTLKEVMDLLAELRLNANIEIKPTEGRDEETTIAVFSQIQQYWDPALCPPLISSFSLASLKLIRQLSPDATLGLLLEWWQDDCIEIAQELGCYSIHYYYRPLTPKRIQLIKKHHFKLLAYTVNQRRQAEALLTEGVDGVFTDYPDLLS